MKTLRGLLTAGLAALSAACSTEASESYRPADSAVRPADSAVTRVAPPPVRTSVLDSSIAALAPRLAPLDSAFAAVPGILRADSGTYRADSLLLEVRRDLDRQVARVVRAFDNPALQVLTYPEGARGQQLRRARERAGQPLVTPDPEVADSIHRFLLRHGIWSFPAEGDTYFVLSIDRLMAIASPFITSPGREALRIEKLEQESPTGGDAAVSIPWDSLGDRLAATDRFLVAFPDAPTRAAIEELRGRYLHAFLTGWDNTAIFNRDTRELRPEVRSSFERFVRMHGSTASADVLREFLDLLARSDYRRTPEVEDFLRTRSGIPRH